MYFTIDIPKKVYERTLNKAMKNSGMSAEQWIQDMVTGALQAHMEAGDYSLDWEANDDGSLEIYIEP